MTVMLWSERMKIRCKVKRRRQKARAQTYLGEIRCILVVWVNLRLFEECALAQLSLELVRSKARRRKGLTRGNRGRTHVQSCVPDVRAACLLWTATAGCRGSGRWITASTSNVATIIGWQRRRALGGMHDTATRSLSRDAQISETKRKVIIARKQYITSDFTLRRRGLGDTRSFPRDKWGSVRFERTPGNKRRS